MIGSKELIIIPGFGDRERLYSLVLPLWRHYGYNAHVFNFGWNNPNTDFKNSLSRLENLVVRLPGTLALIGASAGGTAALHAGLHYPEKVSKIITVSTPLTNPELARTLTLRQSLEELQPLLEDCDSSILEEKVLSVYGLYDHRVAIRRSQYEGMPQLQLPIAGHGLIIGSALTVMSSAIRNRME